MPPARANRPTAARRILLIRPSALGDVCRTTPVLASLRAAYPAAQIDWLVQDSFADAVRAHPALDQTVIFRRRAWADWHRGGTALELAGWLRDLARRSYDLVLDCQGLLRSGFFAWCTRAPVRAGYANAAELGWLGLNRRASVDRSLHAVERMLALLPPLGVEPVRDARLHAPPADLAAVAADPLLAEPFALLAPTSRWPGKRWPAERFAALGERLLAERLVARLVIVGGAGERAQCGPLLDLAARDPRVSDLVGRTGVGRLMALARRAALVVANDSAALHMAVGFDRPCVGLYGPTDVSRVGPYRREASVLQRVGPGDVLDHKDAGIGAALMARIAVEDALALAQSELQRGLGRAPAAPPVVASPSAAAPLHAPPAVIAPGPW